jgi:hypothetical protein
MQPASVRHNLATRGEQQFVREEAAVVDRGADARQILEHAEAGPQVQVPDLAVSHLAGRQTDGLAGGLEATMRPLADEAVPVPHRGREERVA